jgi:hypothetical protein
MSVCGEPPRRVKRLFPAAFWNKKDAKRATFDRGEGRYAEGGTAVVKGISKRVIVVKSPDPKIFEQAIFIVREDYPGQTGISERELMRQAREAVSGCLPGNGRRARLMPWVRGMLYAGLAAAATALTWIMVQMAHVM